MLRTTILLLVGIVGLPIQQPGNPASETAREQDVYAVYSALMTNPPVIGGASNRTYAIASTTAPFNLARATDPDLPEAFRTMMAACDALPAGYEDRWQEILSDFHSHGDAPVPLKRNLTITKNYAFLTEQEVSVFLSSHSAINDPVAPKPQFGGAVAVIHLSNVFFNKDRTLAVTYISSTCGVFCGQGERKLFSKTSKGWTEISGRSKCITSS